MNKKLSILALCIAGAVGISGTALAQTETRTPTCDDAVWSDALLQAVPNMDQNCLEIVNRDGNYFAKAQARVVRQSVNSTVVQFRRPDGGWSPSERAHPPRGFRADIGGTEVRISDLAPRQEVNIYYGPQSPVTFTLAGYQDAAPEEVAPLEVVTAEPEPEPAPTMLPRTAGQTGWLAIFGGMLLLLAGLTRVVRNRM